MLQTVFIWMRRYGGLSLTIGGIGIYAVVLVLEVVLGWRFSYPLSLELTALMILPPAIGVAVLYLQSRDEADEDGHVAQEEGRLTARLRTRPKGREME